MPTATSEATAVSTALLEHLERAWNDADGAAFGEVFTEDCDFVDIRGGHHRGRGAVAAGHQALFDSIYRGARSATGSPLSARCIRAAWSGTNDRGR